MHLWHGWSDAFARQPQTTSDRSENALKHLLLLEPAAKICGGTTLCRGACTTSSDEAAKKEYKEDKLAVADFRPPVTYYTTVPPPINQLDPHWEFVTAISDPARLQEICKPFDSQHTEPGDGPDCKRAVRGNHLPILGLHWQHNCAEAV
ncbi:hypothetical protein PCANC_21034 [Puccinia coronata f. sp. avenae]|uniref:Uncharacterized protein n=1 Tax=Puccinia coronata f. sp. avenae TaxID=200324 RepID=A0A2N5TWC5_9BASI|nr:hypothetical protein PCANC_21034 [Puccinia coronata f. sp. avenae]